MATEEESSVEKVTRDGNLVSAIVSLAIHERVEDQIEQLGYIKLKTFRWQQTEELKNQSTL